MFLIPVILWWAKEPMRFAFGRYRRVICTAIILAISAACPHSQSHSAVADDRVGRGNSSTDDASVVAGNHDGVARLIREGTLVPPTRGKVVIAGRRWAFIADPPAIDRAARRMIGDVSLVTTREGAEQQDPLSAVASDPVGAPTPGTQFTLDENLNLQRIIEALREDATDDCWTLSGEMSEFFGENHLRIRTAQRSNGR